MSQRCVNHWHAQAAGSLSVQMTQAHGLLDFGHKKPRDEGGIFAVKSMIYGG